MEPQEEQKLILVTNEDVKNIRDFFNHFNIDMPDYLDKCLSRLEKSQITEQDHLNLKFMMAKAIEESNHEIFKDELFDEVHPNCEKEVFESQFKEDFEKAMER